MLSSWCTRSPTNAASTNAIDWNSSSITTNVARRLDQITRYDGRAGARVKDIVIIALYPISQDGNFDVPVILVANKIDQYGDRMVSVEEGQRRFREISCACFHEISVRESIEQVYWLSARWAREELQSISFSSFDQVWSVFRDVCRFWRVFTKFPKLKRSTSDVQTGHDLILSPDTICSLFDSSVRVGKRRSFLIGHTWNEQSPDETDELKDTELSMTKNTIIPFRERASTDGTIFSRPNRWKYPAPVTHPARTDRRMSISMRGSKASYWND